MHSLQYEVDRLTVAGAVRGRKWKNCAIIGLHKKVYIQFLCCAMLSTFRSHFPLCSTPCDDVFSFSTSYFLSHILRAIDLITNFSLLVLFTEWLWTSQKKLRSSMEIVRCSHRLFPAPSVLAAVIPVHSQWWTMTSSTLRVSSMKNHIHLHARSSTWTRSPQQLHPCQKPSTFTASANSTRICSRSEYQWHRRECASDSAKMHRVRTTTNVTAAVKMHRRISSTCRFSQCKRRRFTGNRSRLWTFWHHHPSCCEKIDFENEFIRDPERER